MWFGPRQARQKAWAVNAAGLCKLTCRVDDVQDAVRRLRTAEPSTSIGVLEAPFRMIGEQNQSAPLIASFRCAWDDTPAETDPY